MNTADTIRLCIDRCARAKDGRGPWQAEWACATALAGLMPGPVAFDCAAMARRVGEGLRFLSAQQAGQASPRRSMAGDSAAVRAVGR